VVLGNLLARASLAFDRKQCQLGRAWPAKTGEGAKHGYAAFACVGDNKARAEGWAIELASAMEATKKPRPKPGL
jgi:hypothetical protein